MRKKIVVFLILIVSLLITINTNCKAANENYQIIIEDDANLLSEFEEEALKEKMADLKEYGNILLKTTNISTGYYSSLKYIQNYYYSKLQNKSGVAFYIDMHSRQICACATGGLDKIITSGKCDSIMDNVYSYATKGQYYRCATEVFKQMNTLLNGGKIAESMKYICNTFVSIMISMLVCCGIVSSMYKNKKASDNELIEECEVSLENTPITVTKSGTHREYSPSSSGYSGGRRPEAAGGGRRRWIFRKRRKPRILKNK